VPTAGAGSVEGLMNYALQTESDYILLSLRDSSARADELEMLAKAASMSGADLFTPMMEADGTNEAIPTERLTLPHTFFPIGPVPLLALLAQAYGYDHLFIKKEALAASLRAMLETGLKELDISTIIAMAVQNGFDYEVVPEKLFTYHHPTEEMPIKVITVGETEVSPTLEKAFSKSLPRELSGLLTFRKSGGPSRNDQAHSELWSMRYQLDSLLPSLKEELKAQTDWLKDREDTLSNVQAEYEKRSAESSEYKKNNEKLKKELREMKLKEKILEKEVDHLNYRLRRKLTTRLTDSISKRVGKKDGNTQEVS